MAAMAAGAANPLLREPLISDMAESSTSADPSVVRARSAPSRLPQAESWRIFLCGLAAGESILGTMADSDFEFEDDLPDWSDDDDKPKCASAAKERRTEPPLLLTSDDDLLEAVVRPCS
jgi:hypothetical protein